MIILPTAVVYNGKVYVFHQGRGDSGWLWYNVFNGSEWAGDTKVGKTGITSSPSVVVYNDQIYVFHQGRGDSGWLWYNVFDGSQWAYTEVRGTGLTDDPDAVVM
ncbi:MULTISPECIES: hypothetical protein [Okeania]|uniref:Uncharacterized protein n=2 Tax=Microcoleaceae TaxID=1892252 RepID=A0A3N6P0Y0_9CYAN|nr:MULTISPECIES: hypothetical protein [Okeania]NET17006.1 hypothetical protein [Okeania sp. SIO1H6]NET23677.1 hypothetical protein [Okeania sp. SIO1H5]NES78977.1 hypothetical protein [Okeania sp. SIO1H4]NES92301.1 hypothetical protein [Okeania sp. SIO2B9]NET80286.1 hypothetical protein [Okeania sp. SIO1F9]